jgi:hypothetical protein
MYKRRHSLTNLRLDVRRDIEADNERDKRKQHNHYKMLAEPK